MTRVLGKLTVCCISIVLLLECVFLYESCFASIIKPKVIKLNYSSITTTVGAKLQFKVKTVKPKGLSKKVKWKSSNKKIATINKKTGLLKAKKTGKVKVIAISIYGKKFKAICKVVVMKKRANGNTTDSSKKNIKRRWVLASDIPIGATILSEKWTYREETYVNSKNPKLEGYTLVKTTQNYTDYGSWSGWSSSVVGGTDLRQVESKDVSDNNGYSYNVYYYYKDPSRLEFSYWQEGSNWAYYEFSDYTHMMYWYKSYNGTDCWRVNNNNGGRGINFDWEVWWYLRTVNVPATTHKEYRYRDRSITYIYQHKKTESKESKVEVKASENIFDVKKWVLIEV